MSQEPTAANQYLYEKIYLELKEEIRSGKYHKGDWFPPERVLKDRFNTTHLTVRNALAKLVLEGYIERYSGKGTLVIYSRDRPAASQRGPHFSSGHFVFECMDETNAAICEGLEEQFRRLAMPLRISLHHGDPLLEGGLYGQAVASGSLVIFEPAGSTQSILRAGGELRNTIIVRGLLEPARCPQAIVDDVKGARDAMRYLRDLGHRSVAFLSGVQSFSVEQMRRGYEEELAAAGLGPEPGLSGNAAPGVEAAAETCRQILSRHPECHAFLCTSDECAAGAIRGFNDAGFVPGRDCSVIGYGNSRLAAGMGITSLDPGARHLCEIVMSIVHDAMARGSFPAETYRSAPELKLRASCSRST
jgi:DNA-binding LacI/PurR family transcriptional regulator/DNA-binding transcriptional regulator YhcF (GntR family)